MISSFVLGPPGKVRVEQLTADAETYLEKLSEYAHGLDGLARPDGAHSAYTRWGAAKLEANGVWLRAAIGIQPAPAPWATDSDVAASARVPVQPEASHPSLTQRVTEFLDYLEEELAHGTRDHLERYAAKWATTISPDRKEELLLAETWPTITKRAREPGLPTDLGAARYYRLLLGELAAALSERGAAVSSPWLEVLDPGVVERFANRLREV